MLGPGAAGDEAHLVVSQFCCVQPSALVLGKYFLPPYADTAMCSFTAPVLGPKNDLCGLGFWGREIAHVQPPPPQVPCVPRGEGHLSLPNLQKINK